MLKRSFVFVLSLIFAFSLTACSDNSGDKKDQSTQSVASVANNTSSNSEQAKVSESQLVLSSSLNTKVVG